MYLGAVYTQYPTSIPKKTRKPITPAYIPDKEEAVTTREVGIPPYNLDSSLRYCRSAESERMQAQKLTFYWSLLVQYYEQQNFATCCVTLVFAEKMFLVSTLMHNLNLSPSTVDATLQLIQAETRPEQHCGYC